MRFVSPKLPLLVALIAAAGISVSASAQEDPALLGSMRKAGSVKVAINSLPPWMSLSPSGEPRGYFVEVLNLALKGMNLPPMTAVFTAWDGLIPGLQARQYDMIAPAVVITEARCKVMAFSSPVWVQQDAMFVVPGNPKKITGYAGVAQMPDVKIAVVNTSAQEVAAVKAGVKPEQLVRVPDIQAGVATVTGGRVSAFAVGQFSVTGPREKGVEPVVDPQSPINAYGIVFRKEDIQTRDAFDKQLSVLRGNGAMKELYSGKYGISNWDMLAKIAKPRDVVPACE